MQEQQNSQVSAFIRAVIVVLGFLMIAAGIYSLERFLSIFNFVGNLENFFSFLPTLSFLLALVMIVWGLWLIRGAGHLPRRFSLGPQTLTPAEAAVYRIVFAAIGLFLLAIALPDLAACAFGRLPLPPLDCYTRPGFGNRLEPMAVRALIRLLIGAYFLIGAPGLFGWFARLYHDTTQHTG